MQLRLVRHACAGDKDEWSGPDEERPLDPGGRRQAEALADELGREPIGGLITSPTRRCIETLEPIAQQSGQPIRTEAALSKDASLDDVRALLRAPNSDGAVLCTHGEVLELVLREARGDGAAIDAQRDDDDWLLLKSSIWDLEVDGQSIRRLRHSVPLPIPECPRHAAGE